MPTVAQLVDALALITGERRARVNMMARRLIDDGLMPKSSGRDVAQVDAASVVNLIFAVAFAEKAADAARTAREWGDLMWVPDEHHDQMEWETLKKVFGISSSCNLRKAFTSILTLDIHAPIEVNLSNIRNEYNMAILSSIISSSDQKSFFDVEMEFGAQYADGINLFSRAYLINCEAILALRKILRVKDLTSPSGWVGETSEGGDG